MLRCRAYSEEEILVILFAEVGCHDVDVHAEGHQDCLSLNRIVQLEVYLLQSKLNVISNRLIQILILTH